MDPAESYAESMSETMDPHYVDPADSYAESMSETMTRIMWILPRVKKPAAHLVKLCMTPPPCLVDQGMNSVQ